MTSVLVKQNPSREREDDHQTRINERRWTDVRFQVADLDDPMGDKCQRQPAQNADHPRWEVRTENVDRRRMMAGHADRDPTKNNNCEPNGGKSQNCSNSSHLSNDLAARGELCVGLTVRGAGRARSPTLKARAAWLV